MSVNCSDLPSALDRIDEIRTRAAERTLVVFLDYDGTMTPIVESPELALLPASMKASVERLARWIRVAVISGRSLADVRQRVGIDSVFYAGSHGFEIEGPGGWRLDSLQVMDYLPRLDLAERILRARLAQVPGALVERKRFSIAIHYRRVDETGFRKVEESVSMAEESCPELRRTRGKKVFELQPKLDWNKGKAVDWLVDALGLDVSEALPIFIGDDITDEDAFSALRESGVGIIVRDEPRPTLAGFALESPDEVRQFLDRIRELVQPANQAG